VAYRIKIDTKKQLKEPDEFISTMERLVLFSRENVKHLLVGLAIVFAIGVAYAVFNIKGRMDNNKAVRLEYDASRYYFGSDREKTGQDLKKAIEIYQKILSDYGKSSSAPIASYYLGNAHMEIKEYDAAINVYKVFLQRYPERSDLVPLVYQRLGFAYLAKGDNQNALESFNKATGLELAKNRDQSLYESGRILEQMGNKDEAIKKYKEIITGFTSSPYSGEAQAKIKGLGGDQGGEELTKDDQKNKK
jgi:tetratricopeptide (TPR) repeat protein